MKDLSALVAKPAKTDINTGLSPCKPATLTRLLGHPRQERDYGTDCKPVTGEKLHRRIVTKDVGPFRVTGLDVAVASLQSVMRRVRNGDPEAYAQIKTAGMLCCRYVRGSKKSLSNHSWGTAIDIQFGSAIDPVDDGKVQLGLLRVYRFFHQEGWYWGAGFGREDSMHFELADETVQRLLRKPGDHNK